MGHYLFNDRMHHRKVDMPTLRTRLRIPVWVVAVVALLAAGTVAAVTVSTLSFNPISPAEGQVQNSAVEVDSSSITYTGLTATQVNVTINNTDTTSHTVDVEVTVKDSGGAVQDSAAQTGVSIGAGSTQTLSFGVSVDVTNLAEVEVFVEETA